MLRTAFLIALFLLPNLAFAQTFNVSTTAQLRSAFENAAVNGEDDTIILEAGTYKTTADSLGTFKFSDTEAHNLTIKAKDGLTATDVVLDGANTHQALNLTNTKTATFTLERVTVRNGKSSYYGGGVYCDQNLIVTNSTISGNTATGSYGGGIHGSTVTVTNSTISGNTANSFGGGGIYGSTVTVTNSTISGNTATGSYGGGGIYGHGTFINNIFDNNSSDIYFDGNSNVYNNYIDYTKLQNESSYTIVKKNNIQPSSGSLNFADSSFRLGAGSVAIDKGIDPNSTTFTNLFTSSTTLKTIQDALKTDKDGNTRISAAIDLGAYEYNAASTVNNCAATLSSDLKLHIPILTFNGQSYWADLKYTSGSNFTLSNAGAVTDTSSYSSCTAATLSSSYKLHIPALTYSNVSYWADFQYSSTEAVFTLTGAAAN